MRRDAGFTLIEILVVSLLLAIFTYSLFKVVRDTVRVKEDIDVRTEISQGARATLSLFERDVRSAFLLTAPDLGWAPATPQPNQPPPPPAVLPIEVTVFQGHASDIFLTAMTHQRLSQESPENEQHFVTYQLNGNELVRAESLRAVSTYNREEPDRFHQYTLLKKVSKFALSYWDGKNDKWFDEWDTESAEHKDTLPDAVKVDLEYMPEPSIPSRRKIESVKMSLSVRPMSVAFKPPPTPTGTTTSATPGAP